MAAVSITQPSYASKHPRTHQVLQPTQAEVVPAGDGMRVQLRNGSAGLMQISDVRLPYCCLQMHEESKGVIKSQEQFTVGLFHVAARSLPVNMRISI